ncbi:hypothetical protein PSACC_02460, partial [Paramicrosporidium saccamoebae]
MHHLVIFLLLGQVLGALQFGTLFRHQKLNSAVKSESDSLIDLSDRAFMATLHLEGTGLKVGWIDGMGILLVPKMGKMKTPDTNNVIKVQRDDIIIIYHGLKFQKTRYNKVTAERLKQLVESDTSGCVFGVTIQNALAPEEKMMLLTPSRGFADYYLRNAENSPKHVLNLGMCMIFTPMNVSRLWLCVYERVLEASVEKGGAGILIRNGDVVERFGSKTKFIPLRHGDVVLAMLPKEQNAGQQRKGKNPLPLDQAIALIQQGNRSHLGKLFPDFTSFVATIVEQIPSYLEETAFFGVGEVTCGKFGFHSTCEAQWEFDGNSMNIALRQANVVHIKNEKNKDVAGLADNMKQMEIEENALTFGLRHCQLPHLKPRDIVVLIVGFNGGSETIKISTIKRALSGCKTSADLQKALNGLNFHPTTTAMAAFISDRIPPSKLKMASLTTNELTNAAHENTPGIKYANTVAFKNVSRKFKLESGKGEANHDDLEVEEGDLVMVLLPSQKGESKYNPLEIGSEAQYDLDDVDGLLTRFFPDGAVAAIAVRCKSAVSNQVGPPFPELTFASLSRLYLPNCHTVSSVTCGLIFADRSKVKFSGQSFTTAHRPGSVTRKYLVIPDTTRPLTSQPTGVVSLDRLVLGDEKYFPGSIILGAMQHLVIVLLLGQVFGALQFGTLFRHQKLNRVVKSESNSLIDISDRAFSTMLRLEESARLKVGWIDGMGILLVPKVGRMKTPDTNNVIKVQRDDIIIIYHGPKFQKDRYNKVTAERLKQLVESDTSACVFGVTIQNALAPEEEIVPLTPNRGFVGYYLRNVEADSRIILHHTGCIVKSQLDVVQLNLMILNNALRASVERGGTGALIRDGRVVERFGPNEKLLSFRHGDVVLAMLPKKQDTSRQRNRRIPLPLDEAISHIQQGNRSRLGKLFPDLTSFVATIVDDLPSYLEDAVIVGEGTMDCGSLYSVNRRGTAWWFEGNTIKCGLQQANFIHIENEETRDVAKLAAKMEELEIEENAITFNIGLHQVPHLKPRDIVVFISGFNGGSETIKESAIKHALSGCKTSADLQKALNGLKFHPTTTAMAAFISDKIPPSKLKM